ncbi:unnamed protein product [Discosporangium mesarthrocarpum]
MRLCAVWGAAVLASEEFTHALDVPLSERELKTRAGYYTTEGKYLGGIPDISWDLKSELYLCKDFSPHINPTICTSWTTTESSDTAAESGTCTCRHGNGLYCQSWFCSQNVSKALSEAQNLEITYCDCAKEYDNGNYCQTWTCVVDGNQANEQYDCLAPSLEGQYCQAWTGFIESVEEVESTACECMENVTADSICSRWRCLEKGLSKCEAMDWCDLGISVGVGGGSGLLATLTYLCFKIPRYRPPHFKFDSRDTQWLVFLLMWWALWSPLVVIKGGQDGAMWVALLWFGPVLLLWCSGPLLRCLYSPRKPRQVPPVAVDVPLGQMEWRGWANSITSTHTAAVVEATPLPVPASALSTSAPLVDVKL